jgi:prevent-host-death family protein
MNKTIGIFEAKTKFSEICELVASTGREIMVTRRGKSIVRIVPVLEDTGQASGATAGVLDRLKENEAAYGKASRMESDFPDVWQQRVSKADSPLGDE